MSSFFGGLFGGQNESDAANRNRGETQRYQTSSLNTLDDAMRRSAGAYENSGNAASGYYGDSYNQYQNLRDRGMGYLDSSRDNSLASLNRGRSNYDQLAGLGDKYGAATKLYMDSLGVNGSEGNTRAQDNFHAGPGYQFTLDQGLGAINRRRAASGMLASGNADADAIKYGTGLADQTYGNWQDRLGSNRQYELGATQGAAQGRSQFDSATAQLYQNDGQNRVGLDTTATGGMANANTGRAGTQQWMGGGLANLYQGDAGNRLGVYGNVNSNNQNANNMEAQGRSQGQRNLFNAGLAGVSLAASIASGGMSGGAGGGGSFGSLFGGGGGGGGTASTMNYGGQTWPMFT